MRRHHLPCVLAGAALTLACLAGAAGADPTRLDPALGPQIGNLTYHASLVPAAQGVEDVDDYVGLLAAGERVTVRIRVPSRSGLYPEVGFVAPDGTPVAVEPRARKAGRDLELRNWVVPETGVWRLRVTALYETFGAYDLRIGVARPLPLRHVVPPDATGSSPVLATVPFGALAGSRLDVKVDPARGTAVAAEALLAPSGDPVRTDEGTPAVAEFVRRRDDLVLSKVTLDQGDGSYTLQVSAPAGHGGFTVKITLRTPARARGTRRLTEDEPRIDPLPFKDTPIRGTEKRLVRIPGRYFSAGVPPVVLFGDAPGTEVVVEPFGTYLDVRPPVIDSGARVRVAVVNPDGQAHEQPDYFYFVPEPRIDDIVDASGAPVRGGSTAGGRQVRITGANFQTGVFLRFGGSEDVLPQIRSDSTMDVVTPPGAPGTVEVHVLDAYLHDVQASFLFEYKDPPVIETTIPYDPERPVGDGTAAVKVTGTFDFFDVVLLGGTAVETTWLNGTTLEFVVPALDPGIYTVGVRDRVGTVVEGVSIQVVAP